MKTRLISKRTRLVPFASSITLTIEPRDHAIRIGTLTGALALTIIDASAKDGDEFLLLLTADATGRTVTVAGTNQGTAGTVVLGSSVSSVIHYVYSETTGKYGPVKPPTT